MGVGNRNSDPHNYLGYVISVNCSKGRVTPSNCLCYRCIVDSRTILLKAGDALSASRPSGAQVVVGVRVGCAPDILGN